MAQDGPENKSNTPSLYEQFSEILNPEVQKMMLNAVSGETYFELFQKASNSVLKRLGLLTATAGLTSGENQIDPIKIIAANGSKDSSVINQIEAHVQETNAFNKHLQTKPPTDPENRGEHLSTQHLAILEANKMFDALLQENDFKLDTLSINERAAFTSHMLSKPEDQRAKLAKELVNRDRQTLEGLNPIDAILAGFDPTDVTPLPEAELGSAEAFNLVPPLSQPKSTLAPPMEKVSRVVVKGESPLGYRDWNRGTSNDKPLSKAVDGLPVAYNDILDLTHEEHLARSGRKIKADNPQRLFAIGRYQIIPTTAIDAFKFLGYTKKQKYTPEVQDNMFKYLLMGKRKPLYDYIKDEKGSDKGKAVLEMAKEFASIGVPYDVQVSVTKRDANNKIVRDAKGDPVKEKVTRKKGDSYFGQPAPTTPEDIGKQLDALRELYKKDPDALEPMGPKQKQAKAVRR